VQWPAEAAPKHLDCPDEVPEGTRCLSGTDSAGAHYLIAIPKVWNGQLFLHAHGGPELGAPALARTVKDLQRWTIAVRAGYAWAGSTYSDGGLQIRRAATDTERLRRIFVGHVAAPRWTILHGQSYGAGVAAKAAEMFGAGKPYDAVLLTSGVLGGGPRSYDFRLDLRVVYQYLCANLPKPDEPPYPLWMGLPADSTMTATEVDARTRECLGLGVPAASRSADQSRRLATLVAVTRIPENNLRTHFNRSTFHFRDIALYRGVGNVFGNLGAVYSGSPDDRALNAGVARYAADPAAVARYEADAGLSGRIDVPVLTVHGINDGVAFVELEHEFRSIMARGGSSDRLVQVFTAHADHSYLADPVYAAVLDALLAWLDQGIKPTPQSIDKRCAEVQATFGPGCRIVPSYQPAALDTRVPPRQRP
jgi:alpha-beta hydrolase superfamily lysophospholipase